jgi:excisionase family DNA binding protein
MTVAEKLALNAAEAAELVGVSEKTIRILVRDGKLARVPDTDRLLIARAELERWVTSTMGKAS